MSADRAFRIQPLLLFQKSTGSVDTVLSAEPTYGSLKWNGVLALPIEKDITNLTKNSQSVETTDVDYVNDVSLASRVVSSRVKNGTISFDYERLVDEVPIIQTLMADTTSDDPMLVMLKLAVLDYAASSATLDTSRKYNVFYTACGVITTADTMNATPKQFITTSLEFQPSGLIFESFAGNSNQVATVVPGTNAVTFSIPSGGGGGASGNPS